MVAVVDQILNDLMWFNCVSTFIPTLESIKVGEVKNGRKI